MTLKFGDILREARKDKRLTMRELANRVGTSTEYIHELEKGKANPSMGMLTKLTKELGLSVKVEPKKDEEMEVGTR